MLNAARKKATWVLRTALTVLMLAGTPLVVPSVYAADCPNPGAGSCQKVDRIVVVTKQPPG